MRSLFALTLLPLFAAPAFADVKIDEETKKAINRGLEWLAAKQNQDGSFSEGSYQHNTAITSFAMLAFMSQGHLPNQGLYGPEVAKAARFLVSAAVKENKTNKKYSYLIGARGGNMYCHGMATLALCELYGQTGDDDLKTTIREAVDLIIDSQNPQGGWRYAPAPTGADISVTIMQVMALRSAKNAGLHVPDATMKKAIEYIKKCYNKQDGGFSYMPGGRAPGFARTAAGMCVLFLSGEYTAKEIPEAVKYLQKNFDSPTALLLRPILRFPRHAPGRRQGMGRLVRARRQIFRPLAIQRR